MYTRTLVSTYPLLGRWSARTQISPGTCAGKLTQSLVPGSSRRVTYNCRGTVCIARRVGIITHVTILLFGGTGIVCGTGGLCRLTVICGWEHKSEGNFRIARCLNRNFSNAFHTPAVVKRRSRKSRSDRAWRLYEPSVLTAGKSGKTERAEKAKKRCADRQKWKFLRKQDGTQSSRTLFGTAPSGKVFFFFFSTHLIQTYFYWFF